MGCGASVPDAGPGPRPQPQPQPARPKRASELEKLRTKLGTAGPEAPPPAAEGGPRPSGAAAGPEPGGGEGAGPGPTTGPTTETNARPGGPGAAYGGLGMASMESTEFLPQPAQLMQSTDQLPDSLQILNQILEPEVAAARPQEAQSVGPAPAKDSAHEIYTYAQYSLGMDPVADVDLLWIAEQALKAPLPPNWEEHVDPESGNRFFLNTMTRVSSWEHPLDNTFRALYIQLKSQKLQATLSPEQQQQLDGDFTDDDLTDADTDLDSLATSFRSRMGTSFRDTSKLLSLTNLGVSFDTMDLNSKSFANLNLNSKSFSVSHLGPSAKGLKLPSGLPRVPDA